MKHLLKRTRGRLDRGYLTDEIIIGLVLAALLR